MYGAATKETSEMVKKFSEVIRNIREVKEPTGKLKDACWKGYTAVGMKMKNGRKVPNCVPVGEQTSLENESVDTMQQTGDKPVKHIMKNGKRIGEIGIDHTYDSEVAYYGKLHNGSRNTSGHKSIKDAASDILGDSDWDNRRNRPAPHIKMVSVTKEDVELDEASDDLRPDPNLVKSIQKQKQAAKDTEAKKKQTMDKNLANYKSGNVRASDVKVAENIDGPSNAEVEQIEEMPGANMDTRAVHKHLRKSGWSLTRTKGSHDVYTHPKSEKHIAVPRHKQLKAPLVRGIMKDAQVSEDIEQVEESRGHKILATKLAQIDARKKREAEVAKRLADEQKKKEPVKEEKKGSWQKDTGWKKDTGDVVDKTGAKHTAMSRAKHLAKMASRKKVLEQSKGSWQKDTGWKKDKGDTTDKSGATHTAMSRAKHLAKMASRKKVDEQDNNNQVDNVQTPAKKSLAFRGVVKNTIQPTKGKKVSSDDKFEPEPELNTQIMRNNF